MAEVSFRYGTLEELASKQISPGSIYIISDSQEMFFDTPDGQRIQLGKMEAISNEELDKILV